MTYKVRATRNDDGTYALSYGRGKSKLTATLRKTGNEWQIDGEAPTFPTKKECQADWGEWAEKTYGTSGSKGKAESPTSPSLPPPPPLRKRPEKPVNIEHLADPFNPILRYPSDHPTLPRQATPLGVLVQIKGWTDRYAKRIKDINDKLALKSEPGFDPFYPLIQAVEDCVTAHLPPETTDEQTETPAPVERPAAPGPPPVPQRRPADTDEVLLV